MAEIEQVSSVQQELYTILQESVVPVESTMNRLTEQAYEPIVIRIKNISRFHSGHILAEKVFNQMLDEGVWSLVEYHSFHKQYWMGRLS